jgi:hypothetical protein
MIIYCNLLHSYNMILLFEYWKSLSNYNYTRGVDRGGAPIPRNVVWGPTPGGDGGAHARGVER